MTPTLLRRTLPLLVLAMLIAARPAAAQGTSRSFPDPMTFDQVTELLEPLALSPAQRTAVGHEHARYLDGFRLLRAGSVESYLSTFGPHPLEHREERDEIVDATRQRRMILGKVEQLEATLFGAVHEILSDDQRARFPRAIDRRTRARMCTNPSAVDWHLPSLRRLDLVSAVDTVVPPGERTPEVDALLTAYETALTPIYRRIHEARLDLPLAVYDATWEARTAFRERMERLQSTFDLETPEGQERYREAVSDAFTEQPGVSPTATGDVPAEREVRDDLARVSRLGRRFLSDVRGLLDEETADALERRVVRTAFGSMGISRDPIRRRVMKHLDDEGTDPDLRAALTELLRGYRQSRSGHVDQIVAAAEDAKFSGTRTSRWFFSSRGTTEEAKKETPIEKARGALRNLDERTLAAYAALTGEDVDSKARGGIVRFGGEGAGNIVLQDAPGGAVVEFDLVGVEMGEFITLAEPAMVDTAVSVHVSAVDGGALPVLEYLTIDATDVIGGGGDGPGHMVFTTSWGGPRRPRGWLPDAIDQAAVNRLADELGIGAGTRPILDALYDDYLAAFEALKQEVILPAQRAGRAASQIGMPRAGARDDDDDDDPAAAYERIRTAMAAIADVDRRFFADLDVIGPDESRREAIERAVRARRRDAHSHLGRTGMSTVLDSGSREKQVDLLDVIAEAALDLAGRRAVREPTAAYDVESDALFAERWSSSLYAAQVEAEAMQEAMERAAEAPDGNEMILFDHFGAHDPNTPLASVQRRIVAAADGIRALNLQTLPALRSALDEASYGAVVATYQRRAFPTVYRDRAGLEPIFMRALGLEVPGHVRTAVEELSMEYGAAYAKICDRMIERLRAFDRAPATAAPEGGIPQEAFQRYEKLQRDLEADRFDRRNLNQRIRQQLIDALGETFATQAGLVAEPG